MTKTLRLPESYPWLDQTQSIGHGVFDSGWHNLLAELLEKIDIVLCGSDAVLVVLQIKEKLGSLRFYRRLRNATLDQEKKVAKLISSAQDQSAHTCFECGGAAQMRADGRWIVPLCDKHAEGAPIFHGDSLVPPAGTGRQAK